MKNLYLILSMLAALSLANGSSLIAMPGYSGAGLFPENTDDTFDPGGPVAVNDEYYYGDMVNTVTIPILANDLKGSPSDSDIDPASLRLIDPLTGNYVTSVAKPGYGTLTVLPDGQVEFAPGFITGDSVTFDYVVWDLDGDVSNPATITILVLGLPLQEPLAANDLFQYGDHYFKTIIQVLDNDHRANNSAGAQIDRSSLQLIDDSGNQTKSLTKPGYGTLTVLPDGLLEFEPEFTAGLNVAFKYLVSNLNGYESNTATLRIQLVGSPVGKPEAANDLWVYTDIIQTETFAVLTNDRKGGPADSEIDPSSLRLIDPWTGEQVLSVTDLRGYGTLRVLPGGQVQFEPPLIDRTNIKFYYTIRDLDGDQSNVGEISIEYGLPVTLTNFQATSEGTTTLLSWSTTEETGSDRFEIQRSPDGKNWKTLGLVKSSGESKTRKDYSFADPQPQAGQNLFRLKMIDLDGSFALSGIRSIRHEDAAPLAVFPNPATDRLWVQNPQDVKQLDLHNATGLKVWQGRHVPANGIDISTLLQGVYILSAVKKDGSIKTQKILVNRK
jgi:hypothetical protein